jgi:hypothetical protein
MCRIHRRSPAGFSTRQEQMSLLRSNLCHAGTDAETIDAKTGRPYGLPGSAAMGRQHHHAAVICGLLGCIVLADVSCSFDSQPTSSGTRGNGTADPTWTPPSASSDGTRGPASTTLDAATDAMRSEAIAVQPAIADAGAPPRTPTKPVTRTSDASTPAAASGGRRDSGASQAQRMDASQPQAPKVDASQPASTSDAAARAGASAHCKPGLYAGTFSGSIQLVGLSLSTVTGTVRAQLTPDSSGGRLDLHDGRVMGLDQDGNRLTVNLTGSVNCQTDQLENGKLESGNFHNVRSAFSGRHVLRRSLRHFAARRARNLELDSKRVARTSQVLALQAAVAHQFMCDRGPPPAGIRGWASGPA